MEDGISTASWPALRAALGAPYFTDICARLDRIAKGRWPNLDALNAAASAASITNCVGVPIRFVPPDGVGSAMTYEMQIATRGEIPTRCNIHDLFNALQWLVFPQIKRTLNSEHARCLRTGGDVEARSRSTERDVLTMFDESGMIVASSDAALLELIQAFRWRELFVHRRAEVRAHLRVHLVGHGLMEKALRPFIGITGKAILLHVDAQALEELPTLDRGAAQWLARVDNLARAQHLSPLPLLGVPGWDARNEDAHFYDNEHYFRAGRRIAR